MTVQIPASRQDDLAVRLATRIEQRLTRLGDELEHTGIVVYDADRGLATRGGVIRMSVADLAAVVAEVAEAVLRPPTMENSLAAGTS
jgi:hypothetical protein